MNRFIRSLLAVLILAPLVLAPAAMGQTTVNVTYTWTAPTTGSPAVSYDVERSLDAGTTWAAYTTTTSTSAVVAAPLLQAIIVRVRGVDSLGRKGVWSVSSDPFVNDPGPPGACGKPTRS